MAIDCDLIARAARSLLESTDTNCGIFEDAQSPVEDWALDALNAAVLGRNDAARSLLDRYGEETDIEVRLSCSATWI